MPTPNRNYPYVEDADYISPIQGLINPLADAIDADVSLISGYVVGTEVRVTSLEQKSRALCLLSVAPATVPAASAPITLGAASPYLYDENVDALNWHSPSTNPARITPTIAGWYNCQASAEWAGNNNLDRRQLSGRVNGVTARTANFPTPTTGVPSSLFVQFHRYLNGSTDYVDFQAFQNSGSGLPFTANVRVELLSA